MKNRYIILFAKGIKEVCIIIFIAVIIGFVGFCIGKYYERNIKIEYNEALDYWNERKIEEAKIYLEQKAKLSVELNITAHNISSYILRSKLKNEFIDFANSYSLSIYNTSYNLYSTDCLNIEAIKLYLEEKRKQEQLQDPFIAIKKELELFELYSLIDKFDHFKASLSNIMSQQWNKPKNYVSSYEQYRYEKGNLPEIIRKLSPLEIWGSTIIVILVLYAVLKIIILFVRIGTWINKTSKLDS